MSRPVGAYDVSVKTGDKLGAGTDANVYLNVTGERGQTGPLMLANSLSGGNKFEKNKTDAFRLEAPEVGRIRKILIGHDGKGSMAKWYLEEVRIQNGGLYYIFPVSKWLEGSKGKNEIEIEPASVQQGGILYEVAVKTGDKQGAGTDANVFLQLVGERGQTPSFVLKESLSGGNKFERNKTDVFRYEAPDVGRLRRIAIGHDGKGSFAKWLLDEVIVSVPSRGETYKFAANAWLDSSKGQSQIELEPAAGSGQPGHMYEVAVKTGDKMLAGTDANVFIQLNGDRGQTPVLPLTTSLNHENKFDKNHTDIFRLDAPDVGRIRNMRIGHDGKGLLPKWYLDQVQVSVPSRNDHYLFIARKWIDKSEGLEASLVPIGLEDTLESADMDPFVTPMLLAHNRRRVMHASGDLVVNPELCRMARDWALYLAQSGAFEHSLQRYRGSLLGENIASKVLLPHEGEGDEDAQAEELANVWYSEISKYDYIGKPKVLNAGHFTQMVWQGSHELGVAHVICTDGEGQRRAIVVCNYYPPGNVVNRFSENVVKPRV